MRESNLLFVALGRDEVAVRRAGRMSEEQKEGAADAQDKIREYLSASDDLLSVTSVVTENESPFQDLDNLEHWGTTGQKLSR